MCTLLAAEAGSNLTVWININSKCKRDFESRPRLVDFDHYLDHPCAFASPRSEMFLARSSREGARRSWRDKHKLPAA